MKFDLEIVGRKLSADDEGILKKACEADAPELGSNSLAQGAPSGQLLAKRHVGTNVFPDVARDYWIYVPKQYEGAPANLMVFQDGDSYLRQTNAMTVFDNLIAAGDLSPTIVVFVDPGELAGQANRSREYDSVNDAYVRFLSEELLPEALRGYNITDDPAKRAICGMSSGGICAFNAAWERPDLFGLVLSHVGSFTNIRGGHVYPSRVRQNSVKPIRVFLQGGAADLNNKIGNWPIANFDMASSLSYQGYDVRFEFGRGAHDFHHAAAILPQSLLWLFGD